ncbi:hypothetical protein EYM_06670 [Ignicoccus islandicus DSM 13165]|uniref:CBS domain-containing protein n=1 Tax=Ignicoccus islandicus DSM 13165 TaxID=940295 RepID=A0A0U3FS56_9CREN|nr:CBS domain-containing protein [Ignicoccus islandicus]ALU12711.1 hypothetical protein EYM_06670 [Ignicoccus islandicus DSM 13165]
MEEWGKHYVKVMDYATKDVVTVSPETDMETAANLMIEFNIRHLPVKDSSGHFIGMVGLRDVASIIAKEGVNKLKERKVMEYMNVQPIRVYVDDPLFKAVEMMIEHGVGSVIILDSMERIRGILTEKDVVKFLAVVPSLEKVENVMSPISTFVLPGSSIREVLELMTELWTRHLALSKDDEIIGIVSMSKLVKKAMELSPSAPVEEAAEETFKISASTPISQAAAIMIDKGKEALLVTIGRQVVGMVTEGNLVRGALEVLSRI